MAKRAVAGGLLVENATMPSHSLLAVLDKLFGLPAHPLIVHAAIVLVPLAALGTLAIAFWPTARRRIGWIVVAMAFVGTVSCYAASKSGEALQEDTPRTEQVLKHTGQGDGAAFFGFGVFVGSAGVMGLDLVKRRRDAEGLEWTTGLRNVGVAVGVLAVVLSIGGAARIVQVGHSGADAVWNENNGTNTTPAGSLTTVPSRGDRGDDGD